MSNHLASATSPYLRQHASHPVDWYPWGPDAFAEAQRRNRPMLISIGYSSCHWCHVMARESFADPDTAATLNRLFVNVAVDRDEHPDVDALYLEATALLAGRAGWPMTVFAFPDGRPFRAGTYVPSPQDTSDTPTLLEVCEDVDYRWRARRGDLVEDADRVIGAIAARADLPPAEDPPGPTIVAAAVDSLVGAFDAEWGGFGTGAKFPHAPAIDLLLGTWQRNDDPAVGAVVTTTLDAMASGGIHNHLEGGFARYTVDREWRIPHFERLLCDQAVVARCYLHAHQLTGLPRYRQILDETVGFVLGVLGLTEGAVAAAEDAEADGVEGGHWTWTDETLSATLTAGGLDPMERATARLWWGVSTEGNFRGANILWRPTRADLTRPPVVERARRLLAAERLRRGRPDVDHTVVTEWNALWLATLAEAALALDERQWATHAVQTGTFLLNHLRRPDGRWLRAWRPGAGASQLACAADYATLVDAFTRLAELTGDPWWVTHARSAADDLLELFWDEEHGGLFTAGADAPPLAAPTKGLADNDRPSTNSTAAVALARLGAMCGERRYTERSLDICRLVTEPAARHPAGFTALLGAAALHAEGIVSVVVSGHRPDLVRAGAAPFHPRRVLVWGTPWESPLWTGRAEDRPGHAYVGVNGVWGRPLATPAEVTAELAGGATVGPSADGGA